MATDWQACGRGKCAAQDGHPGTCDEASGWAEDVTDWQARAEAAEAREAELRKAVASTVEEHKDTCGDTEGDLMAGCSILQDLDAILYAPVADPKGEAGAVDGAVALALGTLALIAIVAIVALGFSARADERCAAAGGVRIETVCIDREVVIEPGLAPSRP